MSTTQAPIQFSWPADEDVYEYFDGPRLFSCRDGSGGLFLAVNVDADEDGREVFVYAPITAGGLAAVLAGKVDLRTAFCEPPGGQVVLARWGQDAGGKHAESTEWISSADQPEAWRHDPGVALREERR